MKKGALIKSGVLAMALSFGLPGLEASAQEFNSIYITPRVIYSKQKGDMSKAYYGVGPARLGILGGDDDDSNFGFGLAVGTDLSYSTDYPIRVEAEYTYRRQASFKDGPNVILGGYGLFAEQTFDVTSHALMGNIFYDFNTDTPLTPYIGGGLGLSYLSSDYKNTINGGGFKKSNDDWNFAWNLGAGVAYQFSDTIALDLGYRYVDLGSAESGTTTNVGGGYVFKTDAKVDYTAHEFSIGLRFNGF